MVQEFLMDLDIAAKTTKSLHSKYRTNKIYLLHLNDSHICSCKHRIESSDLFAVFNKLLNVAFKKTRCL